MSLSIANAWCAAYIQLQRSIYRIKMRLPYRVRRYKPGKGFTVNILTEPRGWVLHHWAEELLRGINYITINKPEGVATIDYAIPFYFRRRFDLGNISVGYFTHIEVGDDDESRMGRGEFYRNIHRFDCCVAQNKTIEAELKRRGAKRVCLITAGAPEEYFRPKLVLGFIGRNYKNDRKNLTWFAQLEKLDWIEIHYKMDPCHWSVRGERAALGLARFYRNLDFVLVTSKSEGGPMCVLEGLSCGVPIIMPEGVGLYDHFNCGVLTYKPDYESLLALLQRLFQEKHKLFLEGQKYNLDTWRCEHIKMFDWLIKEIKGG